MKNPRHYLKNKSIWNIRTHSWQREEGRLPGYFKTQGVNNTELSPGFSFCFIHPRIGAEEASNQQKCNWAPTKPPQPKLTLSSQRRGKGHPGMARQLLLYSSQTPQRKQWLLSHPCHQGWVREAMYSGASWYLCWDGFREGWYCFLGFNAVCYLKQFPTHSKL